MIFTLIHFQNVIQYYDLILCQNYLNLECQQTATSSLIFVYNLYTLQFQLSWPNQSEKYSATTCLGMVILEKSPAIAKWIFTLPTKLRSKTEKVSEAVLING